MACCFLWAVSHQTLARRRKGRSGEGRACPASLPFLRDRTVSPILSGMRKLAPFLLVAAFLSLVPLIHAPVAQAADFPALPDAGSLIGDAGVIDLLIRGRSGWQMSIRCEGDQATRYRFCESSTCAVGAHHALLRSDTTYDILVPANHRYLSVAADDGGFPACKVQYVFPRTIPEIP